MVATYNKYGKSTLVTIDIIKEKWDYLQLPLDDITSDALWPISRNSFLVIGGGVTTPRALYRIDLDPEVTMWKLRESSSGSFPAAIFSKPEHILFPTSNNVAAHGYFHPPHSLRFQGPESTSPPLIVSPHGGPTGHYYPGLSLETQYWTSRGFAVLLLNYRGSSGHGGAYRTSLQGKWGIFDTEDAVNAVKYLSSQGKIDGSRVGIRGGSSGGYVVLQAICNFPTVFAGATSLYGISHLRSLIEETHKFESHYAERLLFQPGMSEKERATIVEERSPLNHVDHIQSPLLLLHGSIDKVVPLQQSEKIKDALISRGGMAKLVVFEGEGHGFRLAKNRLTALEEERKWWRKTLVRDT
jgi:dipeptidyl aminopeptidase/acylaminoacyl peptidase